MNLATLISFFGWCTIINSGLLMFWSVIFLCAPDFIYKKHSRWFAMPRESWNKIMYCMLGGFKLAIIIFNLVPFIALSIIG